MEETKLVGGDEGVAEVEVNAEVDADGGGQQKEKKVRKRKKRLISQITKQMEFYFSPANVTKDRFMSSLLCEYSYIPVVTFFKFNRIRSLTTDVDLLRTAITKSSVLELSEDGENVRSSEKIEAKADETSCTIYVENIPTHADHEWVRQVFAQYGTIDYISLPRFARSGRPKGFVFVEFGTPEMANSALEAFGALDCRIPAATDPANLQSIKSHSGEEIMGEEGNAVRMGEEGKEEMETVESEDTKEETGKRDVLKEEVKGKETSEDIKDEATSEGLTSTKKKSEDKLIKKGKDKEKTNTIEESEDGRSGRKRKLSPNTGDSSETENLSSDVSSGTTVKTKRGKADEECNKAVSDETKSRSVLKRDLEESDLGGDGKEKRRKLDAGNKRGSDKQKTDSKGDVKKDVGESEMKQEIDEHTAETEQINDKCIENEVSGTVNVVKKKKKKRKRDKQEKEEEVDSIYLRVMSKADWKKLRNKYLNAQKENMNALKRDLQNRYRYQDQYNYNTGPSEWQSDRKNFSGPKVREACIIQSGGSVNESELSKTPSTMPKFAPKTIVKISFEEPPQDPRKLREAIRDGGNGEGVAYVDVNSTERDVYVRFNSSEAAGEYKKTGCWSRMEVLSGTEEEEYWSRITNCWTERRSKRTSKTKNNQTRGNYGCAGGGGELRGREKLLNKAVRDSQNTRPNSHIIFD